MKRPGRRQRMAARGGDGGGPHGGDGRGGKRDDRPLPQGGRDARRAGRSPANPLRAAREGAAAGPRVPDSRRSDPDRARERPESRGGASPAASAPRSPSAEGTPFTLRPGSPFVSLQNLLKVLGAVDSGGGAKLAIQGGEVSVNGEVETRRSRKLVAGDVVEHAGRRIRIAPAGNDAPPSR